MCSGDRPVVLGSGPAFWSVSRWRNLNSAIEAKKLIFFLTDEETK
jgi:hypothetical protein